MRFTQQQNLPCLDGSDMSAVALYMQCLAEQVEGILSAQATEYTEFLNAPVAVWTNTVSQVITPNEFFTFNTVTSSDWPGSISASLPTLPNLRGWYYISGDVTIADGSPTSTNAYYTVLTATQNTGVVGDPVLGQFQTNSYESLTGGESLLVAGTVFFAGGEFTSTAPVDLTLQYRSNAGAGGIVGTSLTPAIRLWVAYLGDTPQIGVA